MDNIVTDYVFKSKSQILNIFYSKKNKSRKFRSSKDFLEWYTENVSDKSCYYCGLTERESQQLVKKGLLKSKRFPIIGDLHLKGRTRGFWLELDKVDPNGPYSETNCVPCCYFCNNDKSDVFTGQQYKLFSTDRIKFLKGLLNSPSCATHSATPAVK
jgi:hypothetical protein